MAIRTIITRGYGNGTFDGTIALVVLRGYTSALVITTAMPSGRVFAIRPEDRTIAIPKRKDQ